MSGARAWNRGGIDGCAYGAFYSSGEGAERMEGRWSPVARWVLMARRFLSIDLASSEGETEQADRQRKQQRRESLEVAAGSAWHGSDRRSAVAASAKGRRRGNGPSWAEWPGE
jgi:hypothetical protein